MRNLFFLLGLSMFLLSPFYSAGQKLIPQKKYLPKVINKLEFGMSPEEAMKKRPDMAEVDQSMDFRKVFVEENPSSDIAAITYYFDNEGGLPLYEFILNYHSASERDAVAEKLFGTPNFEETEWQYPAKEGFTIHAWQFKNKLVIVAKLPGTEWE